MRPEFWDIFKSAFKIAGQAATASYLEQKITACGSCIVTEPMATADPAQQPLANDFKLPKNLEKLDPRTALDPLCTLTEQQATLLADSKNIQLLILPDRTAHIVQGSTKGTETVRTLVSVADFDAVFPVEACRRWYVPDYVDMRIPGAEYSICARSGLPNVIIILITSGGQSLYLPMLGQIKQEDIELTIKDQTYRLTAWNIQERRYKKMVTKSINLSDILSARPGAAKKTEPTTEPAVVDDEQEAVDEVPAEAQDDTSVTDTVPDTCDMDDNVEDVVADSITEAQEAADEPAEVKPAKKTRVRKQAVPGLKLDWDAIMRYLQQPVADDMNIDDAATEMRLIRDVQIAAARRETNIALHVVDKAETLAGYATELANVRDVLSKLKL